MAKQENPPGQTTEGKAEDAKSTLSKWYGNNAIYVDIFEKIENDRIINGIGRMKVSIDRTDRKEPSCVDSVSILSVTEAIGRLTVTDEHTVGHFNKYSGLPSVFPGHKQIRAAVEAVRELERIKSKNSKAGAVLWGFDSVEFKKIVTPGNLLEINMREIARKNGVTWQDVEIKRGSEVMATINNMAVELTDGREKDNTEFIEDQLIEATAQTAGLTSNSFGAGDSMPLFQSIGSTKFYKRARTGDGISIHTGVSVGGKSGFEAFATINANGNKIGQIDRIRATVVPLNVAKRMMRR